MEAVLQESAPGDEVLYIEPDWSRPLDVERTLAKVPDSAQVKGIFLDGVEKIVARDVEDGVKRLYQGLVRDRYVAFKSYSRAEVMRVEVRSAELLFPELPLRDALRKAAQKVYPFFLESMVGRVLFGVLGNDVDTVIRLGPKGYRMVTNFGAVQAHHLGERHWRYHFQDYYSWLDCGDVGIVEGIILHYGFTPKVRVGRVGQFDVWLDIQWE